MIFIEVSCINLYSDSFKLSYLSLHFLFCIKTYDIIATKGDINA